MGASAQLHAHVRNRYNPNLLLIFFSKECECPRGHRLVNVHYLSQNREIVEDDVIYFLLNLFDLPIRERSEVRVIESQAIRSNEGSGLLYMCA